MWRVARLGDRGLQPQHAVRPVHRRATRRRPAARTPTLEQRIATGFNRNHRGNAEGGIVPEEYAVEYVVDRVETTATVWLGLTLGCARCHDHKYDPLTQKEFYRLFAFFNNVPEKGRAVKFGNSPPFIKAPTPRAAADSSRTLDRDVVDGRAPASRDCGPRSTTAQAEWEKTLEPARRAGLVAGPRPGRPLRRWTSRHEPDASATAQPTFVAGPDRQGASTSTASGSSTPATSATSASTTGSRSPPGSTRETPDGAIVSRMTDEPRADGYGVQLDDGKVQVNLVKRWLDDALRVETERPLRRGPLAPRRRHLRRLAARRGREGLRRRRGGEDDASCSTS